MVSRTTRVISWAKACYFSSVRSSRMSHWITGTCLPPFLAKFIGSYALRGLAS